MPEDFSKVSLGFAEFVSQLVHETFDAIMDSQFYQIEKFGEIQKMLSLKNDEFATEYLSDSDLIQFQEERFGVKAKKDWIPNLQQFEILKNTFTEEEINLMIQNNKLTDFGLEMIMNYCKEKIVAAKKSKLIALLNQTQDSKLVIDSGQIKAKLDLSCLSQSNQESLKKPSEKESSQTQKITKSNFEIRSIINKTNKQANVFELTDKITNTKTILIDKTSIKNNEPITSNVLNSRIIASPISPSSTTNLFSEVTINFKVI